MNETEIIIELKNKLAQANNNLDKYEKLFEELETNLINGKKYNEDMSEIEIEYFSYCDYCEQAQIRPSILSIWYIKDYSGIEEIKYV